VNLIADLYFDPGTKPGQISQERMDQMLTGLLQLAEPGVFSVVLHNDPINGVDYVASAIRGVFGYSLSRSIWLMLKAHFSGRCILWTGSFQEANDRQQKLIAFGPDPKMLGKGAKALMVTVQRQL
jgi:ATP-dependent Clp protease adaptor protein ClpS